MPEPTPVPSQLVRELKVSAHLMTLQPGVFCIYHSEGSGAPDPATGLPGVRLSLPPGPSAGHVTIRSFREDGWLGGPDMAALVRVADGTAQVLMTVYMMPESTHAAPKLQVMRLSDTAPAVPQVAAALNVAAPAPQAAPPEPSPPETVFGGDASGTAPALEQEIAAHVQLRGDVMARLGEWVGDRGSQRWIEGFAVAPQGPVHPGEVEYQAVLGRGWLSPWAEGGQYCGSRGMALPILGLRVRLRGAALATHTVEVSATFTDGSIMGPVAAGEPCEAPSLAPLEAFMIAMRRLDDEPDMASPPPPSEPSQPDAKKRRPAKDVRGKQSAPAR